MSEKSTVQEENSSKTVEVDTFLIRYLFKGIEAGLKLNNKYIAKLEKQKVLKKGIAINAKVHFQGGKDYFRFQ